MVGVGYGSDTGLATRVYVLFVSFLTFLFSFTSTCCIISRMYLVMDHFYSMPGTILLEEKKHK